jgi:hypothetical protein
MGAITRNSILQWAESIVRFFNVTKGWFVSVLEKKRTFRNGPLVNLTRPDQTKNRATSTIWPICWQCWMVSVPTNQAKSLQQALKSAASSQQAALPPT